MSARNLRRLLGSLAALALLTCTESTGPPERPVPVPGRLVVELHTPNADDGAVVIYIRGSGIRDVTPAVAAYETFVRTDSVLRVVLVGEIQSGLVLRLNVDDVNGAYGGTVVEVASRANLPRSPSQHWVRIGR